MRAASVNFSFSSPAPEDVSNGSIEGISVPKTSPENLRQLQEDHSSLSISLSYNEDVVREDSREPSLVLLEDKETAYEETKSPGLDSDDDTSNTALNMDENATIPTNEFESSTFVPSKLNKEVQCSHQGGCDAQIQTDKMVIKTHFWDWIEHTEWFKTNKHKVKPGVRQHPGQLGFHLGREDIFATEFKERHLRRGVSEDELDNLWNSDYSEDQVLLREYRECQESIAKDRFDKFLHSCHNRKPIDESHMVPFDQPITSGFRKEEPCNSPNFDGCICPAPEERSWSSFGEEEDEEEGTS